MEQRNWSRKERRAYATLGVNPGATPDEVRRQYLTLAKRWHPDRYTTDPAGQAEAAMRMRDLNSAYETILATLSSDAPSSDGEPAPHRSASVPPEPRPASTHGSLPGSRLSGAQVEAIIGAIRDSQSWHIDWTDWWNRAAAVLALALLLEDFLMISPAGLAGVWVTVFVLLPMIWFGGRFARSVAFVFLFVYSVALPIFLFVYLWFVVSR
jgi:DnaJ domain